MENKMEDKVIIKAYTSVVFVFEEEGHLSMKELRDNVRDILKDTGGKIQNIKLQIIEDKDKNDIKDKE